jgi:hypothetical protein
MFTSDPERIAMHPTYQEIIGMGEKVIPMILEQLQVHPHYWFAALEALTGVDPVLEVDRGNLSAMAKAWIGWGEKEGYISGPKIHPAPVSAPEPR